MKEINLFIDQARTMIKQQGAGNALLFLWEKIGYNSLHFKRSMLKMALLDEAGRIFKEVDDPEYYQWGLALASANYALKRYEAGNALFFRVLGYTSSAKERSLRDNIRHELAMNCNQQNRTEDALLFARKIEGPVERCGTFQLVVETQINRCVLTSAKEILLTDYLAAAREIPGHEIIPGKFDYTRRAEQLMYIVEKLKAIGNMAAAEKIVEELKGLAGSYFIMIGERNLKAGLAENAICVRIC